MKYSSFNTFAKDYHLKRKKPWRPLEIFLNHLRKKAYSFNGLILDLGCANGRNFKILGDSPKKLVGIDISLELLKIAKNTLNESEQYSKSERNNIQLILGNITSLPIRENTFHTVFLIATIHHIMKKSERKKTILQIYTLLRKNGNLIATVWRKWQKKLRNYFIFDWIRRYFTFNYKEQQSKIGLEEFGDKFVPWTLSKGEKTFNRFYHFFSKKELKKLFKIFKIIEFKITGGPTKKDNFFIFARKSEI
ncbi:MAG: class I SAM-dependent methyltransferase [Promethearchaeota archaeon]